ncbi:glutathione S-transferase [Marinobacterium jannaschii]|uniref:glutathione S-transferase n=1 Tax=Marinobacterium jannaschii TaxID=64970 RepID=UPI0004896933|nr:glutathione S-transferase [Marinobacterium jannaschii]
MPTDASLPVLYSFRRCPYAMRARLAIAYSGVEVELREVVLRDKPAEMLQISPKGTVPVVLQPDGRVIEESRDIMRWALQQNDPAGWLIGREVDQLDWLWQAEGLIQENDFVFKQHLDRYKYADRYPEHSPEYYRDQCEVTLSKLDRLLQQNNGYLATDHLTIADMAIFPFIRQCAHVDREWFYATGYQALQQWLDDHIASELFQSIMQKYPRWHSGDAITRFPAPSATERGKHQS